MVNWKNKYLEMKLKYINAKHQKGGDYASQRIGLQRPIGTNSLEYLTSLFGNSPSRTKNKYFVICYGPPGSGKSLSKKLAIGLIKQYFEENTTIKNIKDSFVDSQVDQLVEDSVLTKTDLKKIVNAMKFESTGAYEDALMHTWSTGTKANQIPIMKHLFEQKIKDGNYSAPEYQHASGPLSNTSFAINSNYLRKGFEWVVGDGEDGLGLDTLSETIMYMGAHLGKNIFFEQATPYGPYLEHLIDMFTYHGYNFIFMYPFTNDGDMLCQRTYERGKKIGRFVNCCGDYGLGGMMQNCLNEYENYKNIIFNSKKNIISYMYNANYAAHEIDFIKTLSDTTYNTGANFRGIIDNYLLELKVTRGNGKKVTDRIRDEKTPNFINETQIQQIPHCT